MDPWHNKGLTLRYLSLAILSRVEERQPFSSTGSEIIKAERDENIARLTQETNSYVISDLRYIQNISDIIVLLLSI